MSKEKGNSSFAEVWRPVSNSFFCFVKMPFAGRKLSSFELLLSTLDGFIALTSVQFCTDERS